jgi:hypothetical protein
MRRGALKDDGGRWEAGCTQTHNLTTLQAANCANRHYKIYGKVTNFSIVKLKYSNFSKLQVVGKYLSKKERL